MSTESELQMQLAALQLSLDTEKARRLAAEADAAAEAARRLAAEAHAAAAEAHAAAAEAHAAAEAARRLAAEADAAAANLEAEAQAKARFFTQMRAVSSSSSGDTASNTDEARRGALPSTVVTFDDILDNVAAAEAKGIAAMWKNFLASHDPACKTSAVQTAALRENRDVHPTIARLLAAVLPPSLRVWGNLFAEDDVARARIRPDFTVTHARDSAPTVIGGLLLVEVKLPTCLGDALRQVGAYLRRRVYKLCCERDARGEACDSVFALGVATDGLELALVRVNSGAPPASGSYKVAVPCPVIETGPLTLLDWDIRSPRPFVETAPPGFAVLARLFGAPLTSLGDGAPLDSLGATVHWLDGELSGGAAASGGSAEDKPVSAMLNFEERIGCGGSSDVYSLQSSDAYSLQSSGVVAKVARTYTTAVRASFGAERDALRTMMGSASNGGLVPTLVGYGTRVGRAHVLMEHSVPVWPLLLLRPRGQSMTEWVAARVAAAVLTAPAADAAAADAAASNARRVCACTATLRILDALAAAHAAGVIHCDVRPSNVVIVNDEAMLVDWGSSRKSGEESAGVGVAAFADSRVFEQKTYTARPTQDIFGALYTWLAIAFGIECTAPWLAGALSRIGDGDMFNARKEWIKERSKTDTIVARVQKVLCTTATSFKAACNSLEREDEGGGRAWRGRRGGGRRGNSGGRRGGGRGRGRGRGGMRERVML